MAKKEVTYIYTLEITDTMFDGKEPDFENVIINGVKMLLMADDVKIKKIQIFDKKGEH